MMRLSRRAWARTLGPHMWPGIGPDFGPDFGLKWHWAQCAGGLKGPDAPTHLLKPGEGAHGYVLRLVTVAFLVHLTIELDNINDRAR